MPTAPMNRRVLAGLACLVITALLASTVAWLVPARAGEMTIDVLDVGQGDAILLRSPEGKTVLIDAGDGYTDVLGELRARGVEHLDLVVATHPHNDQIGGLAAVMAEIPVDRFMDNGMPHSNRAYLELTKIVESLGMTRLTAKRGQRIQLGSDATIEVLMPGPELLMDTRSNLNANSVVLRLEFHQHCMLFTGDAEPETERQLIAAGLEPCELLKVAHKGSRYGTSQRFLDQLQPTIAVISVSDDNRYHHPGEETLARLEQAGVSTYRTDRHGDVRIVISEDGIRVETSAEGDTPVAD